MEQSIEELIGGMPSWTEEANCKGADADLFFPERGASTRKAKAVCRACTVQDQCLEYAVENSEKFGIWGGLSERERRRIKRQRAAEFDIRDVGYILKLSEYSLKSLSTPISSLFIISVIVFSSSVIYAVSYTHLTLPTSHLV